MHEIHAPVKYGLLSCLIETGFRQSCQNFHDLVSSEDEWVQCFDYEKAYELEKIKLHLFVQMDESSVQFQGFKCYAKQCFQAISQALLDDMEGSLGTSEKEYKAYIACYCSESRY